MMLCLFTSKKGSDLIEGAQYVKCKIVTWVKCTLKWLIHGMRMQNNEFMMSIRKSNTSHVEWLSDH